MIRPIRVYVAGPYTQGDVIKNIRQAIQMADQLLTLGYAPYVPHLNGFWHLLSPHRYDEWLDLDKVWLQICHAVIRLPGYSYGADEEVRLARDQGIPVFSTIEELNEYFHPTPVH